jgi:transcriptional regulator with XRE-family HTH domain
MKDITQVDVVFDSDFFRKTLKEKKMKKVDVSRLTGIEPSTLKHYESGSYKPSAEKLYRIAVVLDCLMEDLMKEVPYEQKG